ncbi:MAG TPA: hypothetical protein VJ716_07565 [Gaiellaceae bacterium]|nr:hypothetical protein [Gaiellaceae bacterium]
MSLHPRRSRPAEAVLRGTMSPPLPRRRVPGLMSVPARSRRGFMQPDPSGPTFDWSRDGVASLWLLALILGFVLWIAVVGHGIGPR